MLHIPKEYYLEHPQNYNEGKFRMHLRSVLSFCDLTKLAERDTKTDLLIHRLFANFFKNKEHVDLAYDLLRYVLDIEDINNKEISEKRFVYALQESGFFG